MDASAPGWMGPAILGLYRALFHLADDLAGIDVLNMCEAAGLVVSISDSRGRLLHLSDSFGERLGLDAADPTWFQRLRWIDEEGSDLTMGSHPALEVRRTGVDQANVRVRAIAPNGREGWLQTSLTPLTRDEHGWAVLGVGSDITFSKHAESELRRLATHDGLTGLSNRAGIRDFVLNWLAERDDAPTPLRSVAILLLDIDRFKTVNDRYGHQAGDEALQAVAGRLREALRPDDTAARWGGEEFVIIAPDSELAEGFALGEQVRQQVAARPFELPSVAGCNPLEITVSVGVAADNCSTPGDFERLVECADSAMYAAKHAGRNRVVAHDPLSASAQDVATAV